MTECSIPECDNASTRRGWCQKHYKRWQTHGDPLKLGRMGYTPTPTAERFWAKVHKTDTCWLWQGGMGAHGYGLFSNGPEGKTVLVHRYSWTLTNGPVPNGLQLDHLCRVRNCVRPEHLEPVTALENTRRALAMNPDHGSKRHKTHCRHGHAYDSGNTHVTRAGTQVCLTCLRERGRARRAAKRAGTPYRDPFADPTES
jgi:hypothetical protein